MGANFWRHDIEDVELPLAQPGAARRPSLVQSNDGNDDLSKRQGDHHDMVKV
jgi:hypothetical protein